ncbi:mucin-16-like [Prionailurus bengalensis]|uniref:mucin-16-like n=1 Tax=Prionailurus bengalensis TaxID=37029 RepID=UPI001CA7DA59|nr:mucin-16-like [Prionailurus bengalensis]
MAVTPTPGFAGTTEPQTQSKSSLAPQPQETITSQHTTSATEEITVPSEVSTGTRSGVSRTVFISRSGTSIPVPTRATVSPGIPMGINTRLSTSPVMAESSPIAKATETIPPEAISQGMLAWGTLATALEPHTLSAVTQGSPPSDVTTSMDRRSEGVSLSSPSSEQDVGSPSSLVPLHAMTSSSAVSSTLPASSPFPSDSVTSPLTAGLPRTHITWGTSSEGVTSSPSGLSQTSVDVWTPSEVSTTTEAIHPSENTAVTHKGTLSSPWESRSSAPAGSEIATRMSPIKTSSLDGDATASTPTPGLSGTTEPETQSQSSMAPEPQETGTFPHTVSATEDMSISSKVSTESSAGASRTDVMFSSRTSTPGPVQLTVSPDILTEINTRLSTSPVKAESEPITMATETGPPGTTSQGTLAWDTSDTPSGAQTHSAVTQGSPHSEMTTSGDRVSEDESPASPSSEQDISSPSSLVPSSQVMSLTSSVSPTLPASSPFPSDSVTSPLTAGLPRTHITWGTSSEGVNSSPSGLSQTSVEIWATPEASTTTNTMPPSENTAMSQVGTLGTSRESHSSAPAGSESATGTSLVKTSSLDGDTMVSTPMPDLSATTEIKAQSMSSRAPEPRETGTSRHTSSAPEEITVLSELSTGNSAEASRTPVISPSRTSIPGPGRPTLSPDIPTGINNRLSISPVIAESSPISNTTKTVPRPTTSQGSIAWDSSATASWTEMHSVVTQSSPHSDGTTSVDRVSEAMSRRSPSTEQDIRSPSSLEPFHAMTSASAVSPTLPATSPSPPASVTSPLTLSLLRTWGMSSESVTSSDAGPSGISVETQATSEAFSTTEAIHPPKTTAVTHMGTLSTAWEAHSSAPAVSETATGTSPIETSPTGGTTMAVTPTPGFAGTTEPQTQPKSSLAPQPQETITSQHTTSATEEITVPSEVSTGTRSGVSRTVFISRSGTSIPVPTRATVSPGIPMGINTRLSASPVMAESSPIAMATETIPPEAISQGMLAWGTLATALEPHTLSAVTQGSPPSDVTTSMDRRSEGVSLSSPSSEQDVGSPSSLVPLHAMTSSSAVSSTLPASSPFPSDSVTSPLTAGLPRTHITWGTSSEGVTSSPSGLSQTSVDVWTPSEVSTTTEAIHPSENTAVTHKGTLSSPWESRSSAPAGSEIATRMSPIKTSSLDGDATASTPTPGLSGTTEPETQSQSSMAPEPQETGTFPHTVSATEDMSISSKVSTESSAGASRTDVMFSSRTSTPGPVQLTVSPDILTEINTRLSTSPVKAESEPITMATETGPPGTTSQGTLAWDTSDTPSGAQTHSAVTQGSPHSEMTTSGDRVSEDESPASPSSEQDISSPSSLVPSSQVMSLTSSVSPTLPASSPFPSDSVTSPLTAGLPRTHITWGTSSEGVNSSPSGLSQTSVEIWATPEASTTTNTMPPSENTAVSQVGTLGTSRESHSSAPAGSESATGTSLVKTSSLDGDTMVSTPMPDLSATTEIKAQSMSSRAPEPRETGTSRHTSSAPEEITVLSELSTGNSAEASRTPVISPSRTSIPGPGRPTLSPDIPTGINNRLSISPVIAESSPISNTTKTVPRPTTSQGSIAWDSSATASWTEMHSVVTQSSPHSDGTTSVDRVSEAMSRRSPSTEQDIRSPSSLEPFHAMTSASAVSPTLPATSPSPPASVTSPLTLSLLRTWGMSSESVTSSDAGPSGISVETQATSEAFSTTEAIHPPKTTAVTHMGTLSTAWEAHSSAPAVSETATGTSPIETSPTGGTTMAVTPTPGFAGTTEPQTQPKSSLAPQPQETITSQHTTSATEEITVPSEVSTGTRSGVSRTVFISRSGTSIPVPTRATVSPGIPMGINTRLSASPVMAESSPIAMATETIPPEAISQGMLAWGTLATALEPHTLSAVTQGSPPSDVTTSMDRRSEGVSLSSPSSEQDVGSPSSLVPLHAMTSSSAVSSTLPASSPFPSDSVTSPLTAGLPRTHITWGTSSEGVTSSPSGLSQTSVDVWTPSEVSTTTEAIHPSENTAVTHKGTLSSPWESRSSAPAGSEIATRMSPIKTSSLDGDATASTPTPGLSGTTEPETQSQSSMAPEPQETGTFPHTVSATEDMSISSKVSTESSAGASRTDVMFSSRTSTPGPVQLTVSPDILTEINTRLSTSPVKAESEPITMATETGPPGTTSQGTLAWDTSDTPSGAQTHSAVTQGSPHSEMTTSGDRVSEDESPASPSSEQDISSPSSLVPSSQVMSLTSSVSPTLPASSPFPSDSVTSPLTAGLPRTHITWGTSSEGVNSSPSGLSQTSVEIWATPEASTTTNTMPPSENTAMSQVGTLGTSRESHSSAPAGSESATGTSLVKTSSLDGDTMVSTPMPDLSATTEIKAQSMSSQAPEPRETGTSRHTSSAPEEITVLSELSTGNSAEASRTAVISPSRTSIPGPGRPTLSPDIPTGINNRLSISPVIAESSPISNTTKTVPRPTTSQGSIAWDSSATASWTEMHSVVTQSSPHSDGTTSVDRVSEAMSRRSPSTEQDIRSPSSLEPFHAMTSASAMSPTLPATSPSPPASVTSPLSLSLLRTWGMSSESVTSSDAGPSGISVETQATSEAFSTTEAIHPPKTTAVTHMGTLSTAWEAHSSAPAVSETATGTSPIETSPTGGTTMAVTPTPGFAGTTEPQTQSKSSLAPQPQETITSQHTTSATEEITVPSEVSTGTRSGVSRTVFISRSGTSIPVPTRATVSPGIPMGINTRLSTSPVMAESSPIAKATETIPPEAISQGMLAWGTLATALEPHTLSAVTQGSPPSDVTTSMDRRSEGVSLSSPSSEQDVGSPSSLVPLHAMTSSSAVSSTLPASSPFPSDSVTSPLTAGLPRTHITWGTSSEGVTSSPSGLSQTSVDVWTPSEVSTTTEAIHPSENTAVTHKGTLSSPWESRSSAPAGSEIATRMSPIKTSSLDGDATASTPTPGLSGTTEPETQSQSSMAPEPQETGTFPHTVSATEDMSISSKVSTESSAGASRTDVMFSSRTSTPGPVQLTVSPDILTEINTRLSTSPVKAESEPITMATETGPPGTTSQGTLAWDTSDTPSGAQTHSAVTQGSPHSEMTTSGDRVSEDESPASPSSEQDISSPSSLVPSSQVMSLTSSVSPTLPASSPFPSDSVTSPLTAGLPRTHITWGTSSEGVNSSPSGLSQTSVEIWATPEASTTTNTMPPSENTAMSQVGTLGTSRESHSSAPAGSESATGTSLVKTSSLDGDTMVSTPMPDLSATTEIKAQSMSSQAPEPRETGTSRHTSSAPEEITVLSELSTGNSAEASRTAVISPSRTSIPGPGRPTLSPDIPTGINNRLSISPVIAESSPISNTTKTVPRPTTSQGSIAWDSSATASWTEMHSVVTQSSPHSDGTTSVDRVSEAMSRRSPSTEQDIRSPSSLEPFHAMTSASAMSPTLPATSPSPPASVTSPLSLSLLRTWGMSSESVTSSDAGPSGISVETQATSEAFSTTEAIHPPKTTAVTHMGTLSTAWEAHSSAPAVSETATGTSPIETSPTGGTTMAVTPTPGFAGTTEPQTQSKSSLAPQPQETITSQHTTSATEEITVPSEVSTGTRSGVSRTVFISRSGTSIPVPTRATVSPGIPMGINTRLSTSPVMAESSPIAKATETIPPEAISQGMLAWGTLATALEPHTLSAVTQGSPPSDVTTSMDRRSEGVSLSSPSSEQDVGSPSSLVPLHAMTSSSAVSSTLPASSPFPSDSVTSPLTAGLPRTHITWGTSSEGVTSSPSGLSQTSVDVWTPSEVSTTTEAIHPSENTAVTHKGTLSSPWESRSSAPAGSEIATRMSPIKTSSLDGDATASTPTPGLSGTTEPETQPQSSMAPEPQETGTFPHTVSATEDMSISSKVSTESSAGASRTDVMFSSRTSTPGPVQLTVSPDILTEINTRLSTSPVKAESEPITMATETGPPGTTSQGTLAWDTSDTPSGAQTHSAVTQGSPHSEMTTSGDRVSEDESPASPSSEQDISSPSSLVPSSQVMSLTSSVSPTLPASSPFPSDSVTSPLTAGLPRTHITWGTSSEGVNSSPSGLSQTSVEIWATPEASTTTNTMPPSENTAVSQVGTLGTSRESHSSAPAGSESATGTSLVKTSSLDGDTMVSTPMPDLSATTEIKAQSMSSRAPEPRETGTSRHTSSAPEEITVLSELSTGNSAEASRTAVISPSRTSIPGPGRPTLSPDIPTGINNRLSISPVIAESSPISNTTKTVPRPTTSQGSIAWDSSATASWTEMHSVVTQSSPHSDGTTSVDRVSEAMSRRSPSTEQDIRSPSSLEPFHAMTSASAVSPTLPATSPSPPASVTSPLTLSLLRTWGMSSESVTSSDAGPSGISVETQATSEAFSTTEAIHPPKTTAVTHMGSLSTAWEAHSSAPAVSETATGTSPIETSPPGGTTMAVTPMPRSSGTRETETQSKSSKVPEPWETGTSPYTSSASGDISIASKFSTGTSAEASRTDIMFPSRASTPGLVQLTMSPDYPTEINTMLSTSPVMVESEPISMATETVPPGAISQDTVAWGTSATASAAQTHSAVTQDSPLSEMTTSVDRGSEHESPTSLSSEQDISSPSSLVPFPAMTWSSAVSSTLPTISPSPVPVTSPLAPGLLTHSMRGMSSKGVTSSSSVLTSTLVDIQTTSEASTTTEASHLPENTAVTHVGTLTSAWESYALASAVSETAIGTSPVETSSFDVDATASTTMPELLGTTETEIQSVSSLAPEPRATIMAQHTSSTPEEITVPSKVSTVPNADVPRIPIMSPNPQHMEHKLGRCDQFTFRSESDLSGDMGHA